MIDRKGCIEQWYEEETVSAAMEALLLAVTEESECVIHTSHLGMERLLDDLKRGKQKEIPCLKAKYNTAA